MDKARHVHSDDPFSLFSSLTENGLAGFLSMHTPRSLPSEVVIFEEGGSGDTFHLVMDGSIEVLKTFGTPDEQRLGILSAGDCFGEMSLFDPDGVSTATVRTLTPRTTASDVALCVPGPASPVSRRRL